MRTAGSVIYQCDGAKYDITDAGAAGETLKAMLQSLAEWPKFNLAVPLESQELDPERVEEDIRNLRRAPASEFIASFQQKSNEGGHLDVVMWPLAHTNLLR
jgi:hypothetical protein